MSVTLVYPSGADASEIVYTVYRFNWFESNVIEFLLLPAGDIMVTASSSPASFNRNRSRKLRPEPECLILF